MKLMKLFSLLFLSLGFIQCGSTKFDQTPPFKILSAKMTHITGGVPGVSSLDVYLQYTAATKPTVKHLYFRGKKTTAIIEQKLDNPYIVARFKEEDNAERYDLELQKDVKKEYGNTTAKKAEKFPFELQQNEAVLSYEVNGKLRYYKISNIKENTPVRMR
ncbi:conserved exported hypothetical protein [Tenacibaculum litopenaei]|uniref:hypothetical protein n=1 Tax=Tenacibaculum litopenaei TaxID=396016 RepID=UPI0038964BE5